MLKKIKPQVRNTSSRLGVDGCLDSRLCRLFAELEGIGERPLSSLLTDIKY